MPGPPYDALVVGGGVAGLAAATWLGRYRRRTLLLDAGEPRNRWVEQAHGYLGDDPVDPRVLLARARAQLAAYATVDRLDARVDWVTGSVGEGFRVGDATGGLAVGRRIVLATGVADQLPEIDRFFEHYGADVFHCPACDGFEARNRRVVVLGSGAHVAGFALTLLDWAAEVTLVTDGPPLAADAEQLDVLARHGIRVLEDTAVALVGRRGAMEAVRLHDGGELPCELLFFSLAHHPRSPLAEAVGCRLDEDGNVLVDERGETSVAGVYAAGDLTPGLQLLQVAAAKGVVAGVGCAESLRGEPPVPGAPPPAPDPEAELF